MGLHCTEWGGRVGVALPPDQFAVVIGGYEGERPRLRRRERDRGETDGALQSRAAILEVEFIGGTSGRAEECHATNPARMPGERDLRPSEKVVALDRVVLGGREQEPSGG